MHFAHKNIVKIITSDGESAGGFIADLIAESIQNLSDPNGEHGPGSMSAGSSRWQATVVEGCGFDPCYGHVGLADGYGETERRRAVGDHRRNGINYEDYDGGGIDER